MKIKRHANWIDLTKDLFKFQDIGEELEAQIRKIKESGIDIPDIEFTASCIGAHFEDIFMKYGMGDIKENCLRTVVEITLERDELLGIGLCNDNPVTMEQVADVMIGEDE